MATSKEYKDFIIEQLNDIGGITYRQMMGEYLLYTNGLLFGGIYDDRLLVKMTKTNEKYNMQQALPYDGAKKSMFVVCEVDDCSLLKEIVLDTIDGLKK